MKNDNLHLLKKIKKVEISDSVFDKITKRLENRVAKVVPMYKVGIAVALILGLVFGEIYFISRRTQDTQQMAQLNELLKVNNNTLYHE
jgi:uncharacterized protein YneF (UPF0154 family)